MLVQGLLEELGLGQMGKEKEVEPQTEDNMGFLAVKRRPKNKIPNSIEGSFEEGLLLLLLLF
jgi:hypothetical protein